MFSVIDVCLNGCVYVLDMCCSVGLLNSLMCV